MTDKAIQQSVRTPTLEVAYEACGDVGAPVAILLQSGQNEVVSHRPAQPRYDPESMTILLLPSPGGETNGKCKTECIITSN